MLKFTKWIKTPLGIGVVTASLSFMLTLGYDMLRNKPVLSTIESVVVAIWQFLLSCLNFELRVWWVLVGIIILFAILWIVAKISDANSENEPKFLRYSSDSFDDWCWEWWWEKNYYGEYDIKGLHPVCPLCKTPLVAANDFHSGVICPRCKHRPNDLHTNEQSILTLIRDNAKRMMEQEIYERENAPKSKNSGERK